MAILDKNNEQEVNKYIQFVNGYRGASLMQSYNWNIMKSGWDSEYVYIEKDGNIVMAMSLLIRKFILGRTVIYAPRGPVGDVENIEQINEIIKDIDKLAKKYKAFVFRMDPEYIYDEKLERRYKEAGYIVKNRKYSKEDLIQPRYNMILNLKDKTEEEIFKGYSEKTRYNIRVATKKGVEVRYSREKKDMEIFFELYKTTSIRDKILGRPLEYFNKMLEAFDEKELRIYIAEHEGVSLSGAITINFGGKMFYLYGASSNEKRNLMPNYLMQQEMIKWAIEEKCDFYDFGGVFDLNKENGLYKFKEGFCRQEGVTEFIGEIEKIYNKLLYYIFTKGLAMYIKIRKIMNRIVGR